MSVSGLIFLLIWGFLVVLILVLLWHPQRSQRKANTAADHQSPSAVFRDDHAEERERREDTNVRQRCLVGARRQGQVVLPALLLRANESVLVLHDRRLA